MRKSLIINLVSITLGILLGGAVHLAQHPVARQAPVEPPFLAAAELDMPVVVSVEEEDPLPEKPSPVTEQAVQTTNVVVPSPKVSAIPHAQLMSEAGIDPSDHQLVYDLLLDENGWRNVNYPRPIDKICIITELSSRLSCANYYVKVTHGTWQRAAATEIGQ